MIRVLIVEDDPMVAQINSDYIRQVPYFHVAGIVQNGKEAIAYLEKDQSINLIILDIYMPKMNGIEALEELRRCSHDVDVIFVTAAKEKKLIQRGLQLGAVDYLIKPFTFERIRLALEKYQQRYALFQESSDVSQEQLDALFKVPGDSALPKGIHAITLERIKDAVRDADGDQLDLHGMAEELSLSLVTLRFYLDYMVSMGELLKRTRYGSVGRPTYVYIKKNAQR